MRHGCIVADNEPWGYGPEIQTETLLRSGIGTTFRSVPSTRERTWSAHKDRESASETGFIGGRQSPLPWSRWRAMRSRRRRGDQLFITIHEHGSIELRKRRGSWVPAPRFRGGRSRAEPAPDLIRGARPE